MIRTGRRMLAALLICELGEIVDGKRVPLHIDDFCMK